MRAIPIPPVYLREEREDVDGVIGASVKEWREAAGLAQREVAIPMMVAGFASWTSVTVSKIESGARSLKLAEAMALAAILGCMPHDFGKEAFWRSTEDGIADPERRP